MTRSEAWSSVGALATCASLVLVSPLALGQPSPTGAGEMAAPVAPSPALEGGPSSGASELTPGPGFGTQRTCTMRGGQQLCYSSGPTGYCYWVGQQARCYLHSPPSAPFSPGAAAGTRPAGASVPPAPPGETPTGSWAGVAQGTSSAGAAVGPSPGLAAGPSEPGRGAAYDPGAWPPGMVEGEDLEQGGRTLAGHTFRYPRSFRGPFVTTNVDIGAGVEFFNQSDVQMQLEPAPGQVESYTYDRELLFARIRAGLDLAFADVFGLGLEADYLGQVGVSEQSLFLYGAESGYRIAPHLLGRLWRSKDASSQLGLQVFGTFTGGLRAVPQGLLRELAVELADIAQDQGRINCLAAAQFECAFDGVDLVTAIQLRRRTYGAGAGVSFAHGFGETFGLQLGLTLGGAYSSYGWRYVGSGDAGTFDLSAGLSPSFDFAPEFPLGISLEYAFELEHTGYSVSAGEDAVAVPSDASATETGHRLGAGLYFTGRRDLMLGVLGGVSFVDESAVLGKAAADQPGARLLTVELDLRYFF